MRSLLFVALLGALTPKGCQTPPAPPPADVKTAPALGTATDKQGSKASAAVGAAAAANESNPAGPAKDATAGELSVASANLPEASAADRAEALARVNLALTGKLSAATDAWALARANAATLAEEVKTLKAQVAAERIEAAKELARQLQAARDEERAKAKAEQRRIVGWVFYGGSFLLAVAAAVVLGTASYVPFFGPKLAICLGIASASAALLGVAINELLANPWITRVLIGLVVAGIAGAAALAIANHNHHATTPAPAK